MHSHSDALIGGRQPQCLNPHKHLTLATDLRHWSITHTDGPEEMRLRNYGTQVGNTNFNYALQQLGDLTYLWTTPTDVNFTNGTNADYYNPGTVYLLNATDTAVRLAAHHTPMPSQAYECGDLSCAPCARVATAPRAPHLHINSVLR